MKSRTECAGYTLLEMLVYIPILVVILTLGFSAYYRCQQNYRNLKRNAEDIERVLKAGERWRGDIRAAVSAPTVTEDGHEMHIQTKSDFIVYRFADKAISRTLNDKNRIALNGVTTSLMRMDKRQLVTAWQWELELSSPHKAVRVRPLFTFEAVNRSPK